MSVLLDYLQVPINDFRGAWLLLEASDVPTTNSLLAQNVEYLPGLVKTRLGFSSILNTGDEVVSMFNWLSPTFTGIQSFLAYLSTAGTNVGMDLILASGGSVTTLYVPAGTPVGASYATGGYRLFMATFNSQGIGTDLGRVYSNATVVLFNTGVDTLFLPPLQYTPVVTDVSSGIVTAGVHMIGYLLTTRNGFTTSPSPVDGFGNFTAVSHTAPGGKQLSIAITPTTVWPQSYESLQIIMTQASGTQFFLVPDATGTIPYGTNFTVTIIVNIDDGTLAADGVDATPYFDELTQTQIGTGPFKPSVVANYSSRMVYVALDSVGTPTLFISDVDNWQRVTLDQNVIYLPGNLPILSVFVLYNTLYILGNHWTYSVQDNGGAPVTWASPQLIDGAIGTLSPLGVTVNAAQGVAWVVDTDGLYLFSGGAYGTLPISYYQTPDWNRINFGTAAATIQVVDNRERKQVKVIVPLDGATAPNYIMTWDYSRGLDPQSVNYSLDSLTSYNPSAIALVQNPTTAHLETWIGPGLDTNPIMRQNSGSETHPFRDNNLTIIPTYQTALLPPLHAGVRRHSAGQFRLLGAGNTTITATSLDGSLSTVLTVVPESTSPAQLYTRQYDLLSEACTLTFTTTALDAWFELSQLTHFYTEWIIQR